MKRIGVLLESTNCNRYIYETVSALASSGQVELFFLQYRGWEESKSAPERLKSKIQTKGWFRSLELAFFRLITRVEFKLLSIAYPKLKRHVETKNIAEFNRNDVTYLTPIFSPSGLVARFSDDDVEKVRALNLDLILRGNAPGIFKGGILTAAKEGIISFHHGDNRWHRGGPAGFWEVYLRKPSTGFVIQILTEELDGGKILFRGNVRTRRSYTENLVNLLGDSYPFMAKLILQFATTGRLPDPEPGVPFSGEILLGPTLAQSLPYVMRTAWLFLVFAFNRKIAKRYKRWSVAFLPGTWRNASLRRGVQIKNLPGHYFADPFVATRDGRTVCFVEDFNFKAGRGCITAIEILDDERYKILRPVIEEPYHMSYPFLFEHGGELYMIPETRAANAIRLYKCVEFPLKWEFQKEIMRNIRAADSILFEHEGRWWILSNLPGAESDDHCSQMFAYHAAEPFSETWTPHEKYPLVFDSDLARNGGLLRDGQTIIRGRQRQGFDAYGVGLSLAKIVELTPATFREEQIVQVTPDFFPNLRGCHHMHSNGRFTVYDFVRSEGLK